MVPERFRVVLVAGVLVLFIFLRLLGTGYDISNSDAARWHRRSEKFLTALKAGDFASTYQHYQPGVTLMWINAVVKQASFSYQLSQTETPQTLENADYYPVIHGISKTALVLVLAGVLLFQMRLISKLFSLRVALIYGFLLSIEPYMIGIDRWFHLTSLETYLGFTAFLAALRWRKTQDSKTLGLSAVFLALSVLSKLTSLILLPILLLVIAVPSTSALKNMRLKLPALLLFLGIAVATFVVFFPAMWVHPLEVLHKLYSAIFNAVGSDVRATEISGVTSLFFYPLVLVYKLSIVTLILIGFLLGKAVVQHQKRKREGVATEKSIVKFISADNPLVWVLGYFIFYLIILTIPEKKIDRYALTLIPPLLLLIAAKASTLKTSYLKAFGLMGAGVVYYLLTAVHPIYSAYYTRLLGGTQAALRLGIYDNSGEYFAQAAIYLNDQGRDKYTFVPNNVESFSYYYKGNLQIVLDKNTDYVVESIDINRKTLHPPPTCPTLEKSFGHQGYEKIVGVYKCK